MLTIITSILLMDVFIHFSYIFFFIALYIILNKYQKITIEKVSKNIEEYYLEQINLLRKQNKILQNKIQKGEELLSNLLPQKTANEMRSKGKVDSQSFEMVTILFADIQGFTKIAEQMNPETLLDDLDKMFFVFDSIVEKYNIEKIKTIGDAYMCAGGLPEKNRTNPIEVVLAALEMQKYVEEQKQNSDSNFSKIWNLRIGIHTGPVVSGVIGKRKFSYDIWGDSVNVASRMESSGEIGKINISSYTHMYTRDFFDFEYRGKMPVKYKGELEMYFVKKIKDELSAKSTEGNILNNKIELKMALLRWEDIKDMILDKMEEESINKLCFHNIQFINVFCNHVELIATGEKVTQEQMLILKTAALFYISGITQKYENFQEESSRLAKEILPSYKYNQEQINLISNLIELGIRDFEVTNIYEAIISDAYFEYLGDFNIISILEKKYNELFDNKQVYSKLYWYKIQLKKLKNYTFHTQTAIKLCNVSKEKQIEKLELFVQELETKKSLMK